MDNFEEYLRQGEPNKAEKAKVWKTAIGLQQIDGLTPKNEKMTMKKNTLATIFFTCLSTQLLSQNLHFNITRIDSTIETFFSKIQSEIKFKDLGQFYDTLFNSNDQIIQITKYENFTPKNSPNDIWTIIDKYEYKGDLVEKIEHWKTDNKSKMCKCSSWQFKRKGIAVAVYWHPKCSKISLNCDIFGNQFKKE